MISAHPADEPAVSAEKKRDLRRAVLAQRRSAPAEQRHSEAAAMTRHLLSLPELEGARVVTAYVSVGSEPATDAVLEALHTRGVRVLLPVLLPDNDLDWAPYEGPDSLAAAGRGLREPTAEAVGPDAVRDVDVVLLPGLAVSPTGMRLGRGGGSYDRALARMADAAATTVVLLHPDEVGLVVPAEPHDQPVDVAVTALGVLRFSNR